MTGAHAGIGHHAGRRADRTRLTIAFGLIVVFMAAEVATGVIANSLALLSDAGHMLTDAAALGFSLFAISLAARPARGAMTFGFKRAEILSAQANGITLVVLAAVIAYEAIRRLFDPPDVHAWPVLVVALAGMAVNVAATWTLAGADRRSLNIESSFKHLLVDLYGFIGTAVAAVVILLTGFDRADPIVSLGVAALMVRSGAALLRASARVLLEASPPRLDPEEIGAALAERTGVVEVHDLHVWEITSGFPALSAHVLVGSDSDCHAARRDMEALLHERFGLDHTTLQVDHAGGDLLAIEPARVAAGSARATQSPGARAGAPNAAKTNPSNN
jgi:cobalt-zinc-cadmium efflux system protein